MSQQNIFIWKYFVEVEGGIGGAYCLERDISNRMGEYLWTKHSEYKLQQYALSRQRVRRVIRHPDRTEKSIVPGMVACMQIAGTSKNRQEIWVMYEVRAVRNVQRETLKKSGLQNSKNIVQSENLILKGLSKSPTLQDTRFTLRALSPAQKFRLQRQQEFSARSGAVGGEGKMLRIISVWRYPGTSPERDPIPSEILEELRDLAR